MRIGAVDLDGVLAGITESDLMVYFREEFGPLEQQPMKELWKKRYIKGINWPVHSVEYAVFKNELLLNTAYANKASIEAMQKWTYEGIVPAVITSREPSTKIVTELWLAKHGVPYSNLVFGDTITPNGKLLYHIAADFYVTAYVDKAEKAVNQLLWPVNVYLIRTDETRRYKPDNSDIIVVDNINQVNELENI